MIDPKLNEIPVKGTIAVDTPAMEAEGKDHLKRSRTGLSISDTIAGDTLLSSGSRGVDTSGVTAGAGAGAGASTLTAGQANESPSPSIIPGSRGTGTTVRAGANPTELAGSPTPDVAEIHQGRAFAGPNTLDVAQRAYEIWCSKGCPEGTATQDWHQAERELATENTGTLTRAATV